MTTLSQHILGHSYLSDLSFFNVTRPNVSPKKGKKKLTVRKGEDKRMKGQHTQKGGFLLPALQLEWLLSEAKRKATTFVFHTKKCGRNMSYEKPFPRSGSYRACILHCSLRRYSLSLQNSRQNESPWQKKHKNPENAFYKMWAFYDWM